MYKKKPAISILNWKYFVYLWLSKIAGLCQSPDWLSIGYTNDSFGMSQTNEFSVSCPEFLKQVRRDVKVFLFFFEKNKKYCREDYNFVFLMYTFAMFWQQKVKIILSKPVCYCKKVFKRGNFYLFLVMSDKKQLGGGLI